eukprot:TRINITY_DN2461_c0_g1_i2.p1 TRINITY_DN2461_c0_g1~~TRINITY_DN2461_c0_g1_i2.p1  ORF type:complete len:334 (-),score=87.77 TRINITY_DN2461_c0_g1_i2:135-1088(-)
MGRLTVKVLRAIDLAAKDLSGTSDPYVTIEIGNQKHKTSTIKKNLNPTWNQTFVFHVAPTDTVRIQVWDWDRFGKDDVIGVTSTSISDLARGVEKTVWLSLSLTTKGKSIQKGKVEVSFTAEDWGSAPNSQPPQSQGYNMPPQQGGYGQPPPQGYGAPPSQGYPPQGYGAPPSHGYPPQGQPHPSQGYPPQQPHPSQGHPPQQGGYGQPPQQQPRSAQPGGGQILGPGGRPIRRPHGITDPEIHNCLGQFRQADVDGSGTIDARELKALLRRTMGTHMSENLLDRFVNLQMQSLDANRSGQIDFDEFLTLYMKLKNQ